ncbi:short chain dehydrogenase/ reductase [Aspergillus taichungensis]|uniref:Short chain dehydrogenase/ reductase n=1 Tax=Aspergillus taichungensis TaxID=482145 RepID=A0A2J5HMB7_9EURO|nr:short chain dehydrogenase/ reductase [Aspergillus taichungensis]
MPPLPKYEYTGPVDCTIPPDRAQLKGKSVIVTGGANGMGESTVRAFAAEGAFVTIADVNDERGNNLAKELQPNAQFVHCNITSWEEQVQTFEAAIANSPNRSCDVVIANAGISRASGDDLWLLDDPDAPPVKPGLAIIDVNMVGTLYTWKLAIHYFRKQPDVPERDRCFIITGSMVAWIDSPANWQYTCTKYGLRGLMRVARRSSWEQGIRINYVAPCYIKSAIRSPEYEAELTRKGVQFAPQEDVAMCMMRLATDQTINGHSLMITPKSVAKEGFKDAEQDDHIEEGHLKRNQETQLRVIEDRWQVGWSKTHTAEGGTKSNGHS